MSQSIESLNQQFGSENRITFSEGEGGLSRFKLCHKQNSVEGYLYGGHICSFIHSGEELLWMSADSAFAKGEPIRGGVPLCFPWFGPSEIAGLPQHGYLRLSEMQVTASFADEGETRLSLELPPSAVGVSGDFAALGIRVEICLSNALSMTLSAVNQSSDVQRITAALHSYFEVSNVEQIDIPALHGLSFLDKTQDFKQLQQEAPFAITIEHDRVFSNTPKRVELFDPGKGQKIIIESTGNNNTVVWNPGAEKAAQIPDFEGTRQANMVCIEPACALDEAVDLAPGSTFELCQRLWREAL